MAGVNWDAMPVWPAKRAVAYLGIRRSRLVKVAKGEVELPEGAPELTFETEGRNYYFDAESVKELKSWIDKNPDALGAGRARLPAGIARYRAYLSDAMAAEISEMYADTTGFRLVKATRKRKPKPEGEEEGPEE